MKNDILIVGAYGTAGRRIAAEPAPNYPGRVIVAGRSLEKARGLAYTDIAPHLMTRRPTQERKPCHASALVYVIRCLQHQTISA